MSGRRTVLVAAAVIRAEVGGEILLTRRREGDFLGGFWEFPGGKLEEGESPEVALARECREEIAVEVDVGDVLEVAWHAYADHDVLLLFYDCRLSDPSAVIEDLEVAEHAWVRPEALLDYPLPPPDARLVAKLRSGR